jgi:hypothetical protein
MPDPDESDQSIVDDLKLVYLFNKIRIVNAKFNLIFNRTQTGLRHRPKYGGLDSLGVGIPGNLTFFPDLASALWIWHLRHLSYGTAHVGAGNTMV